MSSTKVVDDVLQLIGSTPMVRLNKIRQPQMALIYAKLESFNPGGSVKDRICLRMIEDAEKKGILKPGATIVEPTSGNTGIGLAMVAAVKNYKLILTMPETMNNPSNPDAHRKATAEEILEAVRDKLNALVAGVGTGGTITGVGEVLKRRNGKVKIVAVEPATSAVLSGGESGPHKIQGIGAGFVPKVLNKEVIDEIITVSDDDAFHMAKRLAKEEGLFVGISSGAAMVAALKVAKKLGKGKVVVVILPDTGE